MCTIYISDIKIIDREFRIIFFMHFPNRKVRLLAKAWKFANFPREAILNLTMVGSLS